MTGLPHFSGAWTIDAEIRSVPKFDESKEVSYARLRAGGIAAAMAVSTQRWGR